MPARGRVELVVSFGPTSSPTLPIARAWAQAHADEVTELEAGSVRTVFLLGTEERSFGAAEQLVAMVGDWKTTTLEVDGSPESRWNVVVMLTCARQWLRSVGWCSERFAVPGGEPKCRSCPLFDAEWAAEAGPPGLPFPFRPDPNLLWDPAEPWPEVPDFPPEDWA